MIHLYKISANKFKNIIYEKYREKVIFLFSMNKNV